MNVTIEKRIAKIDRMLDKNLAKLNGSIPSSRRPAKLRQRIAQLAKEKEQLLTPEMFKLSDTFGCDVPTKKTVRPQKIMEIVHGFIRVIFYEFFYKSALKKHLWTR